MNRQFSSGRDNRTRALIEQPLPIGFDASAMPGARVLGSDGLEYVSLRWPTPSDPFAWISAAQIAEDVLAEVVRFTQDEIIVEVGGTTPGPLNFPTLGAAIEYMSRFVPAVNPAGAAPGFIPFKQGTIIIRSGWVAEEQVLIDGGISLGWVRIISEDAIVEVDESALTRSEQYFDALSNFPFMLVRNGASSPRIKTLFECQTDGLARATVGLLLRTGNYLDDLNRGTGEPAPHTHGFTKFDNNCRVHSGSNAFFAFKNFSDARTRGAEITHHSTCSLVSPRIVGASGQALLASNGGRGHLQAVQHELPSGSFIEPIVRNDAAGLVNNASDMTVLSGGFIAVTTTGALGGISQPANVVRNTGMIQDIRVTTANTRPRFPSGTAASPGVNFEDSQNTGFYRPTANIIGVSINGVEAARFTSTGFSWGTTTPRGTFHIAAASPILVFEETDQTADERSWRWNLNGKVFSLQTLNDAASAAQDVWRVERGIGLAIAGQSFSTDGSLRLRIEGGGIVRPGADNTQSLGSASFRWSTVFAGTGTINTSDEREKVWRGPLNEAELRAARRLIDEIGIYQFLGSVAEKGDRARLHTGPRAQRAFAILKDEGLDWWRYAWCCHDSWDAVVEPVFEDVAVEKTRTVLVPEKHEDTGEIRFFEIEETYEDTEQRDTGKTRVVREAGDSYGIRPDQLAFWLIAAQEQRLLALEAKL